MGDMVVYHNFWVSDQIKEGIIGNDFLSKHHAVLDLGKGEMNIRGNQLSLVSRPFTGNCYSLYEQYDDDGIKLETRSDKRRSSGGLQWRQERLETERVEKERTGETGDRTSGEGETGQAGDRTSGEGETGETGDRRVEKERLERLETEGVEKERLERLETERVEKERAWTRLEQV